MSQKPSHLATSAQILVIASMKRVLPALISSELQSKEGVFTPRHVGVHVDLVQGLREVGEALAAD